MAAKIPKNIRFRPDQVKEIEARETEEVDFSKIVRAAVDAYFEKRGQSKKVRKPK